MRMLLLDQPHDRVEVCPSWCHSARPIAHIHLNSIKSDDEDLDQRSQLLRQIADMQAEHTQEMLAAQQEQTRQQRLLLKLLLQQQELQDDHLLDQPSPPPPPEPPAEGRSLSLVR